MSPLISVVMPVYNVERYVAAAVCSVLDQTVPDLELILVDDGSTDGSGEICRSYHDRRIRIVRQENRGLAAARNAGIRHARGFFIAFLDADDAWHREKLEYHLDHFDAQPEVGLSFSHSALMDAAGRALGRYQSPPPGRVRPEGLLMDNPVGNGSSPVLRREALEAVAFAAPWQGRQETCYFDPALRRVEDLDCWLRLVLQTKWEAHCLPEVLTWYRINPGGLSAGGAAMVEAWEQVVEKARGYAPDLIARYERPARARLLRYLAGRAVGAHQADEAARLIRAALSTDPALLYQQPRATWLTLCATGALNVLPDTVYSTVERFARPHHVA